MMSDMQGVAARVYTEVTGGDCLVVAFARMLDDIYHVRTSVYDLAQAARLDLSRSLVALSSNPDRFLRFWLHYNKLEDRPVVSLEWCTRRGYLFKHEVDRLKGVVQGVIGAYQGEENEYLKQYFNLPLVDSRHWPRRVMCHRSGRTLVATDYLVAKLPISEVGCEEIR